MDSARVADQLAAWLAAEVGSAGAAGLVFGLSGGIDSAVLAALAARTLPDRHLAVVLPIHTARADLADAAQVIETFALRSETVDLDTVYEALARTLGSDPSSEERPDLGLANLKARLRMAVLYFRANKLRYLVAGTGNRSELSIGYFTKFGDGAADLMPLGHLVKSEVVQLAEYLGVPAQVVAKPPSADTWRGQTDEAELGFSYEQLERYVLGNLQDDAVRERIAAMRRNSTHKLRTPKLPPPPSALEV